MRILGLITGDMPRKMALILAVLTATLCLPAQGAFAATWWVASNGNDSHDCALTNTACKTFTGAQAKAADGDTIACAGPGDEQVNTVGFSAVTITKALTIDCTLAGGANATINITINAPNKNVRLENMTVEGFVNGDLILITAAASVHIENVKVMSSPNRCLNDKRTGPATLTVVDSVFRDCATVGILILPQGGSKLDVALDNVRSYSNAFGLAAGNGSNVIVKRSLFTGNSSAGVEGDAGAQMTVDTSTISSNGIGIQSNASIFVSNNNIVLNTTAFSGAAGSYNNNRIIFNGSLGTFPTPLSGSPSSDLGEL